MAGKEERGREERDEADRKDTPAEICSRLRFAHRIRQDMRYELLNVLIKVPIYDRGQSDRKV